MEFLAQYGLFFLKAFTLVVAALIILGGMISLNRKPKTELSIISLNKNYDHLLKRMEKEIAHKKSKAPKSKKIIKPTLFVIDFIGDIKATQVDSLREEVSAILAIATPKDEVLLRLESPGGTVNGYGLAASQIQRLRDRDITLTACIDKVAASGGYLMACVANNLIAAPFAIIGSIGVVAQLPNFHRWLEKNNIDVELLTAGEYKRTLTMFGKNTPEGRAKFKQDLEAIHDNFRQYLLAYRPDLNIDKVATGEHWLAADAINLNLVDKLQTSDAYIMEKLPTHKVFQIKAHHKTSFLTKLLKPVGQLLHPFG
jgi:serine protease SohB